MRKAVSSSYRGFAVAEEFVDFASGTRSDRLRGPVRGQLSQ